ncbi:MAG: integrase core domain-containing protein [Polyangia bacterium]|jgi:transposase
MLPLTLQFLIAMIASAVSERLERKLAYALEEVRILKEILRAATGKDRISFTPDQRRRLALAGIELTPKERRECCQIIRPGTILTWFRGLAARKYDSSQRKTGRPRKARDIRKLVVKMALENLNWGYTKIRDALRTGLKIEIGRTTVADILAEEGIEPAPEREKKRTWKQFLKMHWDTLYACDFFSVETLGPFGMVRYMVFFVIEVKSRAVEIAGITVNPGEEWMKQVARNLVDPVDGFLRGATHLIHDRDPLFTEAFLGILGARGVESVKIPAQSPNCNPHAERFVKTIKYECLNHFIIFGERHLRRLIKEFVEHYMTERFHQGIGGQLIRNQPVSANDNGATGKVACRSRLGGVLNYYHRAAA